MVVAACACRVTRTIVYIVNLLLWRPYSPCSFDGAGVSRFPVFDSFNSESSIGECRLDAVQIFSVPF